ncbi:uncharacterized protein LOC125039312 [Penaeus chinensis]|uniref:uncharacterized protein LOC125039312 n=1 Tax=Penaeus chinensis TaxID=139456 RepID=UPI001FB61537|nr:uncharacterized protein LOC125039312 [Penaeus chinensis]
MEEIELYVLENKVRFEKWLQTQAGKYQGQANVISDHRSSMSKSSVAESVTQAIHDHQLKLKELEEAEGFSKPYDSRRYCLRDNRTYDEDKYQGRSVNACKYGDLPDVPNSNFIEKMESFVKELRKPNMDIRPFDGNSLDFNRFMRQFRTKVLNYCTSYDERLNYLEQFTSGEARERIQEFMSLNPEKGYEAALKELEDCYGNNDAVAQAYIKKALDWPVIKGNDVKALDKLSIFLTRCKYDILSMDSVKTLENPDNMRRLVMKLPYSMQERWLTIICNKGETSKPIVFSDLAEFVSREAKKARHPIYGRDRLNEGKTNNPKIRQVFATQVQEREINRSSDKDYQNKCHHCKGNHRLLNCKRFKELEYKGKVELIREKKLCFACLRTGHNSSQCFKKEICLKCKLEHPTIMHAERMFDKAKQNTPLQDENKNLKAELEKLKIENMTLQKRCEQQEAQNTKEVVNVNAEACHTLSKGTDKMATLAIIPVKVKRKNSHKTIQTLAFLDPGSTTTICSEKLMNELECKGKRVTYNLETLTGKRKVSSTVLKDIQISALTGNDLVALSNVHSQDNINICKGFMPSREDLNKWSHLKDLEIPQFDGEVNLLIGNNNLEAYRPLEIISGEEYCPIAAKTRIGWVQWGLLK